jgi:hypothetical protein
MSEEQFKAFQEAVQADAGFKRNSRQQAMLIPLWQLPRQQAL